MKNNYQITQFCHERVRKHIFLGDLCVDATMGNGNDTEFLCSCVGENGRVIAFDIQEQALLNTRARLEKALGYCNYELFLDSHENMAHYVKEDSVAGIMFNLGYLPTGDHRLSTRPETTLRALECGLKLLKKDGCMSICIYSGGDTGFEERNEVLQWLKGLDPRKWLVLVTEYYNRPNHPPIPVLVVRCH